MKCDFCESSELTNIYDVPTSLIGAKVFSCNSCGLLQSVFGNKSNKHTHKSISSGADWGNIRHGKKIRLDNSVKLISKVVDLASLQRVLDIGSNRGHFVNYMLETTTSHIDAIEPDNRILENYTKSDRLNLYVTKFENTALASKYDLIYCCHTLEHVDSASSMLKTISSLLADNGVVYIDVPSISVLKDPSNVEEFFIDKHTYHFNIDVLTNYIKSLGLSILFSSDDGYNIVIIAVRLQCTKMNNDLITNYINNKELNHRKIHHVAKYINDVCVDNRVALYGASKTYDALVVHGKLDTSKPKYIIDDYLFGYVDEVHGVKLTPSDTLNAGNIDIVILLTRSATEQLRAKLTSLGIKQIITFNDLLNL